MKLPPLSIPVSCRRLILLSLCALIVFFALNAPWSKKDFVPSWYGVLQSVSAAVSELDYGLKGYRGYNAVYKSFYPSLEGADKGQSIADLDEALHKGRHLSNPASDGVHFVLGLDVGMVDFYEAAFLLFGFTFSSPFLLLFAILASSLCVYLWEFRNNARLINLGFFVVLGLIVFSQAPIIVFQGITHYRYFPIFGLIPAIHLGLLALEGRRVTATRLAAAAFQAFLLGFMIYARSSTKDEWLFVLCVPAVLFLVNLICRVPVRSGLVVWPAAVALLFYGAFDLYGSLRRDRVYQDAEITNHNVWHSIFIGLGADPDSQAKYGIAYTDTSGVQRVLLRETEKGTPFDLQRAIDAIVWGRDPTKEPFLLFGHEYETVLRSEVVAIALKDPGFVFESYLYKVVFYVNHLLNFHSGGRPAVMSQNPDHFYYYGYLELSWRLWTPVAILLLAAGAFGTRVMPRAGESRLRYFLGGLFLFTLIPPFLTMPVVHAMAESAIVFCVIVYAYVFTLLRKVRGPVTLMFVRAGLVLSPRSPKPAILHGVGE